MSFPVLTRQESHITALYFLFNTSLLINGSIGIFKLTMMYTPTSQTNLLSSSSRSVTLAWCLLLKSFNDCISPFTTSFSLQNNNTKNVTNPGLIKITSIYM